MIVGATELSVSIGTGAPARIDSSKKMNCSTKPRPWPPYSVGHPMPSQPSAAIWRTTVRADRTDALAVGQVVGDLGGQQLVVVGPQLLAQLLVLGRVADVHARRPIVVSAIPDVRVRPAT